MPDNDLELDRLLVSYALQWLQYKNTRKKAELLTDLSREQKAPIYAECNEHQKNIHQLLGGLRDKGMPVIDSVLTHSLSQDDLQFLEPKLNSIKNTMANQFGSAALLKIQPDKSGSPTLVLFSDRSSIVSVTRCINSIISPELELNIFNSKKLAPEDHWLSMFESVTEVTLWLGEKLQDYGSELENRLKESVADLKRNGASITSAPPPEGAPDPGDFTPE